MQELRIPQSVLDQVTGDGLEAIVETFESYNGLYVYYEPGETFYFNNGVPVPTREEFIALCEELDRADESSPQSNPAV